jgi:soluble lytic murein transglycosylase-like protein
MNKIILLILFMIFLSCQARAEQVYIDMSIISKIESNNNPLAYNPRTKAIGLYQITFICLKDYNNYHSEKITEQELFNPDKNYQVAFWYLNIRIPQMLRYYKKEVSIEHILICYNAGIKYIIKNKDLPTETKNYLKKYRQDLDR